MEKFKQINFLPIEGKGEKIGSQIKNNPTEILSKLTLKYIIVSFSKRVIKNFEDKR